jgi:pimeloyl-ACP methyl ester carboxylesterase
VSATLLGLLCAGPSLPLAAQARPGPGVTETALALEDGGEIRYAIALPAGQAGPGAALPPLVLAKHAVDRSRILITGFSMGGRGTWYLAARHPDRFTAAIVMATGPGQGSLEGLAAMPIYVIHSPDDEVVPYEPVEELVVTLAARGYRVQMMRLPGASHGMMGDYVGPLQAAGDWVQQQWRETGGSD